MTVQKTSKLSGLVIHSHLKDGAFTAVNLSGPIRTTFIVLTETNRHSLAPGFPRFPPPPHPRALLLSNHAH